MKNINNLIKELCQNEIEYKMLKDCTEMKRGISATKKDFIEGNVPVISGGKEPAFYCNQFNCEGETITVAGSGAGAGYVQYWDMPIFVNDAFSIKAKFNSITKYIYYCLSNLQGKIYETKTGSGIPHVNISNIENFKIPFPSIEIQQKIADVLSTQDKVIELKQKLIDNKKQQKKWLMQNLLTGKIRLKGFTGEWKKAKLGDIATGFDYGMNVPATVYDNENKYIRITDIDEESHRYLNNDIVSPKGILDKKYIVNKNDILFSRTGASTGKTYLYNKNDGQLFFAGFLIRVNISDNDSYFIFSQTLTERYNKWVKVMSVRSGQPGINANEYTMFKVLLPSIEEQTAIAKILSTQDKEIELLEKELDLQKQKKKALMQLLLSGR